MRNFLEFEPASVVVSQSDPSYVALADDYKTVLPLTFSEEDAALVLWPNGAQSVLTIKLAPADPSGRRTALAVIPYYGSTLKVPIESLKVKISRNHFIAQLKVKHAAEMLQLNNVLDGHPDPVVTSPQVDGG